MLVWIDLETSGIEDHDRILEVAAIVTNDRLVEVTRFHAVTSEANHVVFSKVDDAVLKLHTDNGLWQESLLKRLEPSGHHCDSGIGRQHTGAWSHICVSAMLQAFLMDYVQHDLDKNPRTQIAGSSVWFDVSFLRRWMPGVHSLLERHQFDVSAVSELVKRAWPDVFKRRPSPRRTHRAMSDVEDSLELARYYASELTPATQPGPVFPGPYIKLEDL